MSAAEPEPGAAQITRTLRAADEAQTQALAAALAPHCGPGDCLLLSGDLGAGKTAFARGFIRALCTDAQVLSPTFNLVQTYDASAATLWHFDLYRLKSPTELPEIGLEEALMNGIALVEWPDIAQDWWPENALTVALAQEGETARRITLSGNAARWEKYLPQTL